jgi:hypothetical protein
MPLFVTPDDYGKNQANSHKQAPHDAESVEEKCGGDESGECYLAIVIKLGIPENPDQGRGKT